MKTPAISASDLSQSSPLLVLPEHAPPAPLTRQLQHIRTPSGSFYADAPPWKVGEPGTSPVLPSKHRSMSVNMWTGLNPCYDMRPEQSEYKDAHIKQDDHFPPILEFRYPKDRFTKYTETMFQVGNQQMMRKGSSTMAKTD